MKQQYPKLESHIPDILPGNETPENNYLYKVYDTYFKNNNIEVTINWVRHGESCANFSRNIFVDREIDPERNLGYSFIDDPQPRRVPKPIWNYLDINRLSSQITASFRYFPNLSYIGMQQAVLLGQNFIIHQQYDVVFTSPLLRAIMTAMLALRGVDCVIRVIPFIGEVQSVAGVVNSDYQNKPMKSSMLKRSIKFIKDWLQINWVSNFDDIAVMSTLIELQKLLVDDEGLKEAINNILECKPREQTIYDNCSTKEDIRTIINALREHNYLDSQNIKGLCDKLTTMTSDAFLRGPTIDFSILDKYEADNNTDLTKVHFDYFYSKILPHVLVSFDPIKLKERAYKINLLCVSHGLILKYYFKKVYGTLTQHPLNTQVFEEKLLVRKGNDEIIVDHLSINFDKYVPKAVRKYYQKFDDLNINVCKKEGVKGIINYPLFDKRLVNDTWHGDPLRYASPDVQFYFKNRAL